MKIALVHDDFIQWGGAERVVEAMAEIWPEAPIFTLAYDESVLPKTFPKDRLIPSKAQSKFYVEHVYPKLFFLDPIFFEGFNFNEFDVLISSSTRFAKSIVTQPQTIHFAYINTPPRFLWPVSLGFGPSEYVKGFIKKTFFLFRPLSRVMIPPIISLLRLHDFAAAQRIDYLIGNSQNVARRIEKFYRRAADHIYPFVELDRFEKCTKPTDHEPYYLIVSRLGEHKRVDLAIKAFNRLGWNLKIIGSGPERERLEAISGETIEFLGFVSDDDVVSYLQNCEGFIYPQEEDFGITALEAQAAGKPVIAFRAGGATETVIENKTGVFFDEQTEESLTAALKKSSTISFDPNEIMAHAQSFSREIFKANLKKYVEQKVNGSQYNE
ncbi:glycosyltransferase [candidate division WWE3 bacterium]|uniref:Glycosyltransferase n=1 Tax=candidate division WWE3 bacterium TaxID=2053526 RepID=A0A955RPK2_UNCKA|nr:glycosyltransferase [candidate division WWE3 bacterium]